MILKRIIITASILLTTSVLYAQIDTVFYKHEIRAAHGDALITSWFRLDGNSYTNLSVSYFYRPENIFWIGVNFINYFGEKIHYRWFEYDDMGNIKDLSKSKMKYCAIIAPEIRLSYASNNAVILYGSFAAGVGIENGYDTRYDEYPNFFRCFHLTYFGLSCNFGKNNNIFFGGELGMGFKGLGSIHGGYRF